jgi:hypothetical protein
MREECRLKRFKNRVLRKIFGPKKDDITGEWKRLGNDKLYYVYTSSNIIHVIKSRRMRWAGHVAYMGDGRGFWWGVRKKESQLGKPRHRWENFITMDLQEV